jgi:recombination protein RecT
VAAIGITLNPASKLAYLVPRDGMVCLDISYMGLLHRAVYRIH